MPTTLLASTLPKDLSRFSDEFSLLASLVTVCGHQTFPIRKSPQSPPTEESERSQYSHPQRASPNVPAAVLIRRELVLLQLRAQFGLVGSQFCGLLLGSHVRSFWCSGPKFTARGHRTLFAPMLPSDAGYEHTNVSDSLSEGAANLL